MTIEERRAICLLTRCTFLPASYDKRFVRDMAQKLQAEIDHEENIVVLTECQHACLLGKLHRYRAQHRQCDCLTCLADAMKRESPQQATLFGEEMTAK